jgi:hypothetical protein
MGLPSWARWLVIGFTGRTNLSIIEKTRALTLGINYKLGNIR